MTNNKPLLKYSLDQMQVFVEVIDSGGFAAAARTLGRAQSAITYAIRSLEEETGLVLFDRAHYRPQLTHAGLALLPRVRRLLEDLEDFHLHAHDFAHGVEAELSLVVNEFADIRPVIRALQDMQNDYPSVKVRLVQQPFGDDLDMVRSGEAQVGVVAEIMQLGNEFVSHHLFEHQLVAVAAKNHPAAQLSSPVTIETLRGHLQIVWTRLNPTSTTSDWGIHSLDTWHVTDLDTKLKFLRAGLGWGSMPRHLVEDDLARGDLIALDMQSWEGRDRMPVYSISVVRLKKSILGPAALRFIEQVLKNR